MPHTTAMPSPPITLSQDTKDSLLNLQGDEIRRLSKALQDSEARCTALQREIDQLKGLSVVPSFRGNRIAPFLSGHSAPNKHVRVAQELFSTNFRALFFRDEFVWEEKFEKGYHIRPNRTLLDSGEWRENVPPSRGKSCCLIENISGQWFYLGVYQCEAVEQLDAQGFALLPVKTQNKTVFDAYPTKGPGKAKRKTETRQMFIDGEITASKITLIRVGFADRFQDALCRIASENVATFAQDCSGAEEADSEDRGEDHDEGCE